MTGHEKFPRADTNMFCIDSGLGSIVRFSQVRLGIALG